MLADNSRRGALRQRRGTGRSPECATGDNHRNTLVLDKARARALVLKWVQQQQRTGWTTESVSLEHCSRPRRSGGSAFACNCWVWTADAPGDGWSCFAGEPQSNRKDAASEAYAAAIAGLQIPVTKDYALSAEGLRKLEARRNAGRRQEEQKAAALAAAMEALQEPVLAALFADASDADGLYTPREQESEPLPTPLPPRLLLPTPSEVDRQDLQTTGQKGGKAVQTMQRIVSRESAGTLQGPTFVDAEPFSVPGSGKQFLSVCGLSFNGTTAILGSGVGPKKSAARSAAARAALARLDVAPALPSPDDVGEHAAAVSQMRRLHAMHPFRLWVLQGTRPGLSAEGGWHCALWGRLPHGGRLREFWGEGGGCESRWAIAEACSMAAGQLASLLGSPDAAAWLRVAAQVPMELEDLPKELLQEVQALQVPLHGRGLGEAEIDEETGWTEEIWPAQPLESHHKSWKPAPNLSTGPAAAVPQSYEVPGEGDRVESQRLARGVPQLPVSELREELARGLEDEPVLVVSGGTGSGKSTQIPHYILADFRPPSHLSEHASLQTSTQSSRHRATSGWIGPPRIIVTEPRRIAAISLAERVAWERGEKLGDTVGYSVRGDTRRPRVRQQGSIEFCTIGILLRRLHKDPGLQDVSHVLIDEVHERDIMTDFLLILLKELLVSRADLRVVLMSATIDVGAFCSYFWDCPCMEVPTGPRFAVEEIHLEDKEFEAFPQRGKLLDREAQAREELDASPQGDEGDPESPMGNSLEPDEECLHKTGVWWGEEEKDDTLWELMAQLICRVAQMSEDGRSDKSGSLLCFLPGWAEIKLVQDLLDEHGRGNPRLWVLPLHSSLTKEDQQLIFSPAPEGKIKVILGTNIAESSVTIDDVVVVIDSGLAREVAYDPVRHLSQLETVWVSQSSAIQRAGRAGRVRKGRCYRLYSRAQQEAVPWRSSPEMQRCELSSTCLQALALNRECREFLGRALDPPAPAAVAQALQELMALGAISRAPVNSQGEAQADIADSNSSSFPCPVKSSEDRNGSGLIEHLLPLGEVLSRMPLSPTIGRMLIIGVLLRGVGIACLIAAALTAMRRPFVSPPGKRKESLVCQCAFDATSDILAVVQAARCYEGWRHWKGDRFADREAAELFLVPKRLGSLIAARDGMREELARAGVLASTAGRRGFEGGEAWRDAWWSAVGPSDENQWDSWDSHQHEQEGPDSNDNNPELARALLVAAFPSFVALRRRLNTVKHNTRSGLEAIVSPQSVNAPLKASKQAPSLSREEASIATWWAYGQMQIDTQKQGFLRQVTLVDPYHVALFGGLSTSSDPGGALVEIDGWIELRGGRRTREALALLRREIQSCVHAAALGRAAALPERSRCSLLTALSVLRLAGPRRERITRLLPERTRIEVRRPPAAHLDPMDT